MSHSITTLVNYSNLITFPINKLHQYQLALLLEHNFMLYARKTKYFRNDFTCNSVEYMITFGTSWIYTELLLSYLIIRCISRKGIQFRYKAKH